MKFPLNVLFVAAEADPFIKVGGLGDVAGSLPPALSSLTLPTASGDPSAKPALDIRLVIPLHKAILDQKWPLLSAATFNIPHTMRKIPVEVFETSLDGLRVYLVSSDLITQDEIIYHADASEDGPKYTLFSLAALELARSLSWKPDVLHANDWHTALSVYALSLRRAKDRYYNRTLSLIGVHNMPYLGVGAGIALAPFGLPPALSSTLPWWAQDMPLPLGLLAADRIVAVSPTYAQEILTPEFGSGLDEFLQSRSQDITGILNGLDTRRWDPATDAFLAANYSQDEPEPRLANKADLQDELGLPPEPQVPLLALVTRLDPQKGVDLLPDALSQVADLSWQAVILGTGDAVLESTIKSMEAVYPESLRAVLRFDQRLSRRIYSAADAILIPSRYEPCGLTQMIAMRYGCVPIANATGGLRDTIQDYADFGHSTGFLFHDLSPEGLALAIRRALSVYAQPEVWRGIQVRGMQKDFSWESSARQYFALYTTLLTTLRRKSTKR